VRFCSTRSIRFVALRRAPERSLQSCKKQLENALRVLDPALHEPDAEDPPYGLEQRARSSRRDRETYGAPRFHDVGRGRASAGEERGKCLRRWRSSANRLTRQVGGLTPREKQTTARRSQYAAVTVARFKDARVVATQCRGRRFRRASISAPAARRRAAGDERSLRGRRVALPRAAEPRAGSIRTDDEGSTASAVFRRKSSRRWSFYHSTR